MTVGNHLQEGLTTLAQRHEIIGDIRGSGLFMGVELVRDRESREGAREEALAVVNGMRDRGVLISDTAPRGNVLKIRGRWCLAQRMQTCYSTGLTKHWNQSHLLDDKPDIRCNMQAHAGVVQRQNGSFPSS